MRISVIICTKDRKDELAAALRSLAAQSLPPDEVLVVDAGANPLDDTLREELESAFPLRRLAAEPGLTRQRNLGIRASTGDVLFFFDDDVVLEPDYLRAVAAVFAGDGGDIGAVGGRITNALPDKPAGRYWLARNALARLFLLSGMGDGRLKASGFPAHPHGLADERFIECLSGCGMAFRRDVFTRTRFDEALSGYGYMEDVDISQQVLTQGYRIYYEPTARLAHCASPKARDDGRQTARMLVRNYAYLFRKHWNTGIGRRLAFRWALLGLLVFNVMLRQRDRMRGTLDGLRDLRRGERLRPAGRRVAIITDHLPFGPGETFLIPEIAALLSAGHEVLLLPLLHLGATAHPDAARLLGRAHPSPAHSPRFWLGVLAEFLRHPVKCRRILRHFAADAGPHRAGNVKTALKGLYLAGLVRRWGAEHVHAHWVNYTATLAQTLSALTGLPWSFTAHRYDIVADNRLAEKLREASFARCISRDGVRLMRERTGKAADKARVIHLGVDLPATAAGPGAQPVILCPASLVPVKGHAVLLEAMATLRDRGVAVELWLAGDGELRETLTAQVDALHLQNCVTFLGAVPHDRLLARYAAREVMLTVLPSLDLGDGLHEGIPVALMEAMAHGVPVVSTRTGGIPELLGEEMGDCQPLFGTPKNGDCPPIPGGNSRPASTETGDSHRFSEYRKAADSPRFPAGVLVPPGDAGALADALAGLLSDPEARKRIGAAGRARVEAKFDAVKMAGEMAELFTSSR